jgi:hypothetical protein
MTYPAPPSHAHAAAQLLSGKRIAHGANIPPDRYHLALAAIGAGPDHAVGEVAVALSDHVAHEDEFSHGAVFTDRRVLARTGHVTGDIPYQVITEVRSSTGVLADDLVVIAHDRTFAFKGMPEAQAAAAFLQALLRVHPAHRAPPFRPLVAPGHEDSTGGAAARYALSSRDLRVLPILGMAIEGHRRGSLPADLGADLAARAVLFDRTLAYGRGTRQGWWTSPLGAPDLSYAFSRLLGPPYHWSQHGHARVLDFRLGGDSGAAGAAASTALGLLSLGVLGVGWVTRPGRSLDRVRVTIAPGPSSAGFVVTDGVTPLSMEWSGLLSKLFEILPRIEGRMLIQRAAFGWDAPPEQLDEASADALFRKVAETIGEIDIRIYSPPPSAK